MVIGIPRKRAVFGKSCGDPYHSSDMAIRGHVFCSFLALLLVKELEFPYTGNKLHPTQKPIAALKPLIDAFCPPQGTVLDPFAGSGSALLAAKQLGRQYIGIELDEQHCRTATTRLQEDTPPTAAA
jgi:DNA modification methylase